MNRNYPKALLLLGVLGTLATTSVGQVNPLPFPPPNVTTPPFEDMDWVQLCRDPASTTSPYSVDYGIEYEYDALFGAVMGVQGTVNYSKYCFPPSGMTIPMAGRLGFYIGTDPFPEQLNGQADPNYGKGGSTQDNIAGTPVDDGMGLTFGTYTGVAGNFSIAKIFQGAATGTTTTGQYFGQNKIDTAYWGASDRYFVGETTNSNFRVVLRCDILGDAARCTWTLTNTATSAQIVGMWFGQWVLFSGPQGVHTADFVTAPGLRPLNTDTRFVHNANASANNPPQLEMPAYLDYGLYQSWAYGLQIVLQSSSQIPDQTPCDGIDVGKNGFLLGSMTASDGAMPDVLVNDTPMINGDDAYIQKWNPTTVGAAGTGTEVRTIVAYYRSTWSTSDYSKPYSAVLDAPPIIATSPGNPLTFQNAPCFITVDIDNTDGFSTNNQTVQLEGVEIDLDLPTGMTDANNAGSNHMVQYLSVVPPATVEHVTFEVAVDPTLFGNQNYTVTIIPNPGPTKTLVGTITVASQPYLQLTGTANLVTAPWQFATSDWNTIIGTNSGLILDQDYQVFGWDAVSQDYILQTDPQRGFGSFIVSNQNVGFVPLGGNPQQVGDLQTGAPEINIQPGWNMIANPYNYAIPLSELIGVPQTVNNATFTFSELAAQGFVGGYLAYWNPLTQGYVDTTSLQDLMQPNTGYWIYVQSSQPITLVWPPVFQAYLPGLTDGYNNAPPKVKNNISAQATPLWALQLSARSNGMIDTHAIVGQTTTAPLAKMLTKFKPPIAPVKNAISSRIVVQNGTKTTLLSQALVAENVTSQTWNWQVYTQNSGEVALTWPNLTSIPENVSFTLEDTKTGRSENLRTTSSYSYSAEAQSVHNFKLVVHVGPALPVVETLTCKLTSAAAQITYDLSVNATTTVTIRQNGTLIATVVSNRSDTEGKSTASWNYLDSANRRVKKGTYQVEVSSAPSGGATSTKTININVS